MTKEERVKAIKKCFFINIEEIRAHIETLPPRERRLFYDYILRAGLADYIMTDSTKPENQNDKS